MTMTLDESYAYHLARANQAAAKRDKEYDRMVRGTWALMVLAWLGWGLLRWMGVL